MSFISYAQNFEDIMLWRALKEVVQGFYIDVGANDPKADSVTKAFHDRGWRGLNIEPLPAHRADLMRERPGDINLQCAVGEARGELELWEPEIRGWATLSPEVIAQHQREGRQGRFHKVQVLTLAEICREHVAGDIHFLKIDVEGGEKAVIAGMDFTQFRPWIVVVEATLPNSTVENHQQWEALLLSQGYLFAYADGLNRFYLAQERAALREKFRYPPNVFDDFVPIAQVEAQDVAQQAKEKIGQAEKRARQAEQWAQQAENRSQQAEQRAQQAENRAQQAEDRSRQAEQRAQQAENRAQQAEDRSRQAEQRAQQAENRARQAEDQAQQAEEKAWAAAENARHLQEYIHQLHHSTSWRITRPLRGLKRLARGELSCLRLVLNALIRFLLRHPALWRVLRRPLKSSPWLWNHLQNLAGRLHAPPPKPTPDLSPRANQIHKVWDAALERAHKPETRG